MKKMFSFHFIEIYESLRLRTQAVQTQLKIEKT